MATTRAVRTRGRRETLWNGVPRRPGGAGDGNRTRVISLEGEGSFDALLCWSDGCRPRTVPSACLSVQRALGVGRRQVPGRRHLDPGPSEGIHSGADRRHHGDDVADLRSIVSARTYSRRMTFEDLDADLLWEPMWVGRPAGTHFSAGGTSPLARSDDTNKLETQAVFGGPVDEGDSGLLKVVVSLGVGVLLTIGGLKGVPSLTSWWKNRGATAAEPARAVASGDEAVTFEAPSMSVAAFTSEVEVALEGHRTKMSSAEAQRRIVEIMLAAAAIAENVRALSGAQLEDDAHSKLRIALAELAAPDVVDYVNRALAADCSLLDDRTSGRVVELFGGGRTFDGQYVPLCNDRVAEVLMLPRAA
jgi:hypothetical protein